MQNSYSVIGQLQQKIRSGDTSWVRYGIIAAVLLLSAALPIVNSQALQLLVVLGIIGIVGMLIITRWPGLSLPLLIISCLLVPFNLNVGSNRLNPAMLAVALLGGIWLFDMFTRQRQIRFAVSRPITALFVFMVIVLVSFVAGQVHWIPFSQNAPIQAQIGGMALFVLSALAFMLVAHQAKELRWLEWMTWLFLGLGAIFVIGWLVPGGRRAMNTIFQYGSTSSQFWIWMVSLSFSQAVFNRNLKPIARVGLFVFVGVIFLSASTLTGWKSGWLPAVLSAAVILALYSRRFAVLIAIGAIAAGPVVFADLIASDQYSYTTRVGAWLTIAEIVKANPILGLGPANYYWYTPYFQILNYVAVQFSSHNQYVDIIAQTGLLGLAVFLWFALEVGRLGLRLRNHVPLGFAQAYVYGALGGLVGTLAAGMLGDWIVPFVYNVGLVGFRASVYGWLFLGGLVALEQIYRNSNQSPNNSPV